MKKAVSAVFVTILCLAIGYGQTACAARPEGAGGAKENAAGSKASPGSNGGEVMPAKRNAPPLDNRQPLGGAQGPEAGWQPAYGGGGIPSVVPALAVPPPRAGQMMTQRLNLSVEQQQRLQAVLDKAPGRLAPLRQAHTRAVEALRLGLFNPDETGSGVRRLFEEARNAETTVAQEELNLWMELRAGLSAEQIKQLGDIMLRPGRRVGPPADGQPSGGGGQQRP